MNIGIDIVENKRLENKSFDFIKKILTDKEIEIMNKRVNKTEYLAGRFAVKEAIKKCLNETIDFNEIEVLNDRNSKPIAFYKNYKLSISISHEKNYTVGIAILEK